MKYESRDLDDAARSGRGLASASLSDGVTAYELAGPEGAPVVTLVHGGTIPSFCFDDVVLGLQEAGHRTLRYDMYGRGWSDRPEGPYTPALYRRQLLELWDSLQLEQVDLVGFSFGGAIATHVTARDPGRIRRLALVAPVVHYPVPLVNRFMSRAPVVGPLFLSAVAMGRVVERAQSMMARSARREQHTELFLEQLTYRGFQRALLDFVRHSLELDYTADYEAVGRSGREVLLVWGTEDTEVAEAQIDTARRSLPKLRFRPVEGQGHGLPMEAADVVNAELLDFLGGGPEA